MFRRRPKSKSSRSVSPSSSLSSSRVRLDTSPTPVGASSDGVVKAVATTPPPASKSSSTEEPTMQNPTPPTDNDECDGSNAMADRPARSSAPKSPSTPPAAGTSSSTTTAPVRPAMPSHEVLVTAALARSADRASTDVLAPSLVAEGTTSPSVPAAPPGTPMSPRAMSTTFPFPVSSLSPPPTSPRTAPETPETAARSALSPTLSSLRAPRPLPTAPALAISPLFRHRRLVVSYDGEFSRYDAAYSRARAAIVDIVRRESAEGEAFQIREFIEVDPEEYDAMVEEIRVARGRVEEKAVRDVSTSTTVSSEASQTREHKDTACQDVERRGGKDSESKDAQEVKSGPKDVDCRQCVEKLACSECAGPAQESLRQASPKASPQQAPQKQASIPASKRTEGANRQTERVRVSPTTTPPTTATPRSSVSGPRPQSGPTTDKERQTPSARAQVRPSAERVHSEPRTSQPRAQVSPAAPSLPPIPPRPTASVASGIYDPTSNGRTHHATMSSLDLAHPAPPHRPAPTSTPPVSHTHASQPISHKQPELTPAMVLAQVSEALPSLVSVPVPPTPTASSIHRPRQSSGSTSSVHRTSSLPRMPQSTATESTTSTHYASTGAAGAVSRRSSDYAASTASTYATAPASPQEVTAVEPAHPATCAECGVATAAQVDVQAPVSGGLNEQTSPPVSHVYTTPPPRETARRGGDTIARDHDRGDDHDPPRDHDHDRDRQGQSDRSPPMFHAYAAVSNVGAHDSDVIAHEHNHDHDHDPPHDHKREAEHIHDPPHDHERHRHTSRDADRAPPPPPPPEWSPGADVNVSDAPLAGSVRTVLGVGVGVGVDEGDLSPWSSSFSTADASFNSLASAYTAASKVAGDEGQHPLFQKCVGGHALAAKFMWQGLEPATRERFRLVAGYVNFLEREAERAALAAREGTAGNVGNMGKVKGKESEGKSTPKWVCDEDKCRWVKDCDGNLGKSHKGHDKPSADKPKADRTKGDTTKSTAQDQLAPPPGIAPYLPATAEAVEAWLAHEADALLELWTRGADEAREILGLKVEQLREWHDELGLDDGGVRKARVGEIIEGALRYYGVE